MSYSRQTKVLPTWSYFTPSSDDGSHVGVFTQRGARTRIKGRGYLGGYLSGTWFFGGGWW
jgi:hypothetical protein